MCSVVQSSVTLCGPMDSRPSGSSVRGIFRARILEQVAISNSRGPSWPRNRTQVSCVSCIGKWILGHCDTWEAIKWRWSPIKWGWRPFLQFQGGARKTSLLWLHRGCAVWQARGESPSIRKWRLNQHLMSAKCPEGGGHSTPSDVNYPGWQHCFSGPVSQSTNVSSNTFFLLLYPLPSLQSLSPHSRPILYSSGKIANQLYSNKNYFKHICNHFLTD